MASASPRAIPTLPDEHSLAVLAGAVFATPKARPPGHLDVFLRARFDRFLAELPRLRGPLHDHVLRRRDAMRSLASSLQACAEWSRRGRRDRAREVLEFELDEQMAAIDRLSLRLAHTVGGSRAWYRISTWPGATRRRDIFHLPFERRAPPYRFSAGGEPALYLGNNIRTCWLECGRPALGRCRVARFELRLGEGEDLLNLPANHAAFLDPLQVVAGAARHGIVLDPRRITNAPYRDDVSEELADYLALWPLLMAATVRRRAQPAADDPPEYTIPQLLARWATGRRKYAGLRCFTSRGDPSSNSNDLAINVVLPTRERRAEGFCGYLRARVRCTPPEPMTAADRVADAELLSPEAAAVREAAHGRTMIRTGRGLAPYVSTRFGRMEYRLDRPEAVVADILDDTAAGAAR